MTPLDDSCRGVYNGTMIKTTNLSQLAIDRCPRHSLLPEHYRTSGICRCFPDDPGLAPEYCEEHPDTVMENDVDYDGRGVSTCPKCLEEELGLRGGTS